MLITENCNYFNIFIEVKYKRKYSAEVTLCKYMLQDRRNERHDTADKGMCACTFFTSFVIYVPFALQPLQLQAAEERLKLELPVDSI